MNYKTVTGGFRLKPWGFVLLATLLVVPLVRSEVVLNGVFGDHMVLQRELRIPVWGKAAPGEVVRVSLGGEQVATQADAAGHWRVDLSPRPAGGPFELAVEGTNKLVLRDVLVGDVWVCSGQSNMEFPMGNLKTSVYSNDLATADHPAIRHGAVAREPATVPRDSTPVKWTVCHPTNIGGFTAVGYYFGRELERELKIPIGLLHTSWGGTSAEGWTSREALATVPAFDARANQQIADLAATPERLTDFPAAIAAWEQKYGRVDPGNRGEKEGWARTNCVTDDWQSGRLMEKWEKLGVTNGGIVWLRKEFVLPESAAGNTFRLDFGWINEQYTTAYFNGQKLGDSGRAPSRFYNDYVRHDVPGRLVRAGTNVLAVRVVAATGSATALNQRGRLLGLLSLGVTNVNDECWLKVELPFAPLPATALAERPAPPSAEIWRTATTLYNGMLHPLIPFAIKGVLWYQGEQDAWRAYAYRQMLPLMIDDWRARWGQGSFPFYLTQLANWQEIKPEPGESAWAEMRESQAIIARSVTNSGLAVAVDVGNPDDIHPLNKRDVGRRLALVALAKTYGKPVEFSGPVYAGMSIEGDKLRLRFTHAEGLRSVDGGPLRRFAIAGEDRRFVWAEARLEGDSVVLSSPKVAKPVAARYAWADSPEGCNLSNPSGLPAVPFRTDDWPGVTVNNK
jgi:sialate O-acetylesterase